MSSLDELVSSAERAACRTDSHLKESDFCQQFRHSPDPSALRTVLERLSEQNAPRIASLRYPEDVKDLVQRQFDKIRTEIAEADDDFFDVAQFRFRRQLRILSFGRVPVGPEHLEIDGVPRSVALRGGPKQTLQFAKLLINVRRLRVFPFYVLHLGINSPKTFLFEYSAREQKKMFRRIAECLRMNPDVLGVSASAWWYDPAIRAHSEYLWYLREGWEKVGGQFFDYGTSEQNDRLATQGSAERTRLFEEGKYHPRGFLVACTRDSLLQWADSE